MSTSEKGFYCIECMRLMRDNCNTAIRQFKQYAAKEKPIIFSSSEIKAILGGEKTQTRRVIKPQPHGRYCGIVIDCVDSIEAIRNGGPIDSIGTTSATFETIDAIPEIKYVKSRYSAGDILWVRETWLLDEFGYQFKVLDNGQISYDDGSTKWQSPMHMPRAAARLFLCVKNVYVERLQEISNKDAIAEGCTGIPCDHINADLFGGSLVCTDCMNTGWIEPPRAEFIELWNNANAKRGYGWDSNPWVEVDEFGRL